MTVRANSWLQRVGVEESALGGCRGGPAVCPGWGLEGRGEGGVLHCPLGGMLESTTSSPDWVERECGNIRIWSRHGDGKNAGAGRGRGSPRVCGEEGMHCIKAVTVSWWQWWQSKASVRKPEISLSLCFAKALPAPSPAARWRGLGSCVFHT